MRPAPAITISRVRINAGGNALADTPEAIAARASRDGHDRRGRFR
jgi:hypothetical protein